METADEKSASGRDQMNAKNDPIPESTTKSVPENEIPSSDSESSDFDREYTCDVCEKSFTGIKPLRQHERSGKHLKALRKQKLKQEIEEDEQNEASSDEDFGLDKNTIYAECEVCCKEFNGPESYRLHMRSKRHKKKVTNSKILEESKQDGKINMDKLKVVIKIDSSNLPARAAPNSSESDEDITSNIFECETCEKVFNGLEPFRDHVISKTHRKTLKEKEMILKLTRSDPDDTIELVEGVLTCKLCHMSFSGAESAKFHLKGKRHLELLEFKKWKIERKNSEKHKSESVPEASCSTKPNEKSPLTDKEPPEITDANEKRETSKINKEKEKAYQARISYQKYKTYNI